MTDYKMAMKILLKNDFNAIDFSYARMPAIEALEKQIPKKPKGETDPMFGDVATVCPNCGNRGLVNPFVKSKVYDYCPKCGQALDWSDTQ